MPSWLVMIHDFCLSCSSQTSPPLPQPIGARPTRTSTTPADSPPPTVTAFTTQTPTTILTLALLKVYSISVCTLNSSGFSIYTECKINTHTHTHSGSLLSPSVFPVSRVRRFSSGGEEDGWNHNINRVKEKTFTEVSLLCFKLVFVLIFNELFH